MRRKTVQPRTTLTVGRSAGRRPAFTIVELIVVIALVALVLGLAIPGLNVMNAQARLSGASQTLNVALTRAYYTAVADGNMAALRLLPAEWDMSEKTGLVGAPGRQHAVVYSYTGVSYDPDNPPGNPWQPQSVRFTEYFSRRAGVDAVVLPEDVWAAPVEALSNETVALPGGPDPTAPTRKVFLAGKVGAFAYDAAVLTGDAGAGPLLNADDFLIVIDPKTGVCMPRIRTYPLRAYAPPADGEVYRKPGSSGASGLYTRFGASGVILYPRGPFLELGRGDGLTMAQARQDYLRAKGRAYLAQRYGGGLSAARPRPQ